MRNTVPVRNEVAKPASRTARKSMNKTVAASWGKTLTNATGRRATNVEVPRHHARHVVCPVCQVGMSFGAASALAAAFRFGIGPFARSGVTMTRGAGRLLSMYLYQYTRVP